MWTLFNNRDLFQEPVHLRGFELSLDRLVANYRPHSAQSFDFSRYSVDRASAEQQDLFYRIFWPPGLRESRVLSITISSAARHLPGKPA